MNKTNFHIVRMSAFAWAAAVLFLATSAFSQAVECKLVSGEGDAGTGTGTRKEQAERCTINATADALINCEKNVLPPLKHLTCTYSSQKVTFFNGWWDDHGRLACAIQIMCCRSCGWGTSCAVSQQLAP